MCVCVFGGGATKMQRQSWLFGKLVWSVGVHNQKMWHEKQLALLRTLY